jgi:hypothetical protein
MKFSFFISLIIVLQLSLPGCKKSSFSNDQPEFSFTYNGNTYNNPAYGRPAMNGSSFLGIIIDKPDVLGGVVSFYFNYCSFLDPGSPVLWIDYSNCNIRNGNGSPIDSSVVFLYRSGSYNRYNKHCKQVTGFDLFTGATSTWTSCTDYGDFTLVLGNNAGLTKTISGHYSFPGIHH